MPHRVTIVLLSCLLLFLLATEFVVEGASSSNANNNRFNNRFNNKNKKGKEPPKPKPKPKPVRINEAILPKYETFLEELQLIQYLPQLLKLGFVDTKHILRSTDMDYRMLQYDTDIKDEDIARLKAAIKEWLAKATLPDEKPIDPGYEERKKLRYGRLYFPNAVQTVEYLLASFGGPPPIGLHPILLSKNQFGCNASDSTSDESDLEDAEGTILVVKRGGCSFLDKALEAKRRRASALVIVNNEDRLESPASGLGIEPNISEASVMSLTKLAIISTSNTSWATFEHNHRLAGLEESKAMGQLIPLKCVAGGKCFPLIDEEKTAQAEISAGSIRLRNSAGEVKSFEFLTSTFGGNLPAESFPILISNPLDACSDIQIGDSPKGSALLSVRGSCSFDLKAGSIDRADAILQILYDENDTALQRIGGALPGAGYVRIPTIYVVNPAAEFIKSSSDKGLSVSGHITGYADQTAANNWIELSYAEWAEDLKERLVQLEGHLQKHLQEKNADIAAWLRRQADKVKIQLTESQNQEL